MIFDWQYANGVAKRLAGSMRNFIFEKINLHLGGFAVLV